MKTLRTPQRLLACLPLVVLLTACGAWQSVKETTVDAARAVFVAKVKRMNLSMESRSALNPDDRGAALPVVLRVYQLKNAKALETATYTQLLEDMGDALKADDARYVGVVVFFRDQIHSR